MSFIKESYAAYKKVQEAKDHEISMARGELEAIADKATQLASMLQGKSDEGNPLEAWVQSKITKAKDYINSVSDYMMYNPKINESYELEETTFEKIYQMQQDGKSVEDIAKELNLKADLVKKVLGESKTISEGLSDAQIAQLKKEYEPLKGKTITTSQYQQLKNILFKLQDGDLEKLQKQNIPFASTGAGSILRVRKSPVKITSVKVPGLEGMAEAIDMSKVTKYKMISIKGDQKEITIDREDLEKHLKLGYVIKEPLTEEKIDLQEKPSRKKHVVFKVGDKLVAKDFRGYNDDEIAKSIDDFLKQNSKSIVVQQSPIQSVKEEHTKDEKTAEKIALAHIDERPDYYDQLAKVEKQPVAESHFEIGQHVIYHGPKNPITPIKAQIIGVATPQTGAYYQIKKSDGETTYAAPDQMKLDEACWTGYKQVGLKKKGKKMVPNCVPEERRLYIESIVAVKNKAEKTGMPYSVLKQVYDRGMAAWKGGHRPGATQVQWALARVNSFVTKSSGTWGGADSDLAKKVKG
jgi:hypothetical protein